MAKPTPGKQYTVIERNTLSRIARQAYGNAAKWPRIWRANMSTLRSGDPDLIYPGEVIFIPEIGELLGAGPALANRQPDEFTIALDGLEITSSASRILRTMDTLADAWTATIQWIPGKDPELDRRVLQYSYTPAKVYIGGKLMISGRMYDSDPETTNAGTIRNLGGFSKTIDMVDSVLKPPYEESNVTLVQRARKIAQNHGLKVVVETDTGGPFDRVTANESEKQAVHLGKLATQRGVLQSSTPDGNYLLWDANTDGKPVATLEEGFPPVGRFAAQFRGRERFHSYRGVGSTPKGEGENIVQDNAVPTSRMTTFRVNDVLEGEIAAAMKWTRNRALANALTMALPVAGWLDPRGKLWEPNTLVTIVSPTWGVPDGFTFLIRSVELEERENEKSGTLNIVPPQVYTKGELIEPWK
jgi:prophage tail gpP-like protein